MAAKKKVTRAPDLGVLQVNLEEAKAVQDIREQELAECKEVLDAAQADLAEASIALTEAKRYTEKCYSELEDAAEKVLGHRSA